VRVRADAGTPAASAPAVAVLWTSRAGLAEAVVQSGACTFMLREGEEFWAVFTWGADRTPWSVQQAQAAMDESRSAWQKWARLHPWLGPQRAAVLGSQRAIRLLSLAETGSQVAAPTTSLPERIGGDRNYDYRFAWVRDSSLALATMAVFGDLEAARRYMDWLAARPAGARMPLQVLYRIDGGTDATERELQDVEGYRGSRPVRVGNHAADQLQLDSLGYLADCVHIYLQQGGAWRPEYSRLVEGLADFTVANWRRRDHGIWELDQERHYVSSKVMAWVVLERAGRIRSHLHEPVPAHWSQTREAIHAEVMQRGWSESAQSFRQHYDADDLDASVLLASLMEFLPGDHPRMLATIAAVQKHLQRDGFVWRFHPASLGHPEMPLDGLEAAFVPCTFWLASALARAGRTAEARQILDHVDRSFGEPGLFAEEFDPRTGQALGNHPLLFSHAEHLRAVMDLAKSGPLGFAGMMAGKAAGAVARAMQPS
ncbi:MAG: glycoside hydrolase family 15 protein, partial [Frateuria sp.]|nr:glycoside hydrolase family 15 protein [Frateuria sp.]